MSTTRGTWNYRVVRRYSGGHSPGEMFLAIREAHYEEDEEKPVSITVNASWRTSVCSGAHSRQTAYV